MSTVIVRKLFWVRPSGTRLVLLIVWQAFRKCNSASLQIVFDKNWKLWRGGDPPQFLQQKFMKVTLPVLFSVIHRSGQNPIDSFTAVENLGQVVDNLWKPVWKRSVRFKRYNTCFNSSRVTFSEVRKTYQVSEKSSYNPCETVALRTVTPLDAGQYRSGQIQAYLRICTHLRTLAPGRYA